MDGKTRSVLQCTYSGIADWAFCPVGVGPGHIPFRYEEGLSGQLWASQLGEYISCGSDGAIGAEHFTEDITIESVSEALYLSPGYVSKIFSQKLRYGFREYINALRIDMAKALLKNADKRITDIMLACGFANQSSFNRVFRNICGVSPKDYRKTVLR